MTQTAQQLNSSTAQQLNSSTAQQLNSSWAKCDDWKALTLRAAMGALTLVALGCGSPLATADRQRTDDFLTEVAEGVRPLNPSASVPGKIALEAGVVFSSEASYICFPLSRFGIEGVGSVQSVDSSCECVRPTIVGFSDSSGETKTALRLDFIPESSSEIASDQSHGQPSLLSVEVRFKLANADELIVVVNFLHTYPAKPATFRESLP